MGNREKMIRFIKFENAIEALYVELTKIEAKFGRTSTLYQEKLDLLREMIIIEEKYFLEIYPCLQQVEDYNLKHESSFQIDPLGYIVAEFDFKEPFNFGKEKTKDSLDEEDKKEARDNLLDNSFIYQRTLSMRNFIHWDHLIQIILEDKKENVCDKEIFIPFVERDISYLTLLKIEKLLEDVRTKKIYMNKNTIASLYIIKYSQIFGCKMLEQGYLLADRKFLMKDIFDTLTLDSSYVDEMYNIEGINSCNTVINDILQFIEESPNQGVTPYDYVDFHVASCELQARLALLRDEKPILQWANEIYQVLFEQKPFDFSSHSIVYSYIKQGLVQALMKVNTEESKKLIYKIGGQYEK